MFVYSVVLKTREKNFLLRIICFCVIFTIFLTFMLMMRENNDDIFINDKYLDTKVNDINDIKRIAEFFDHKVMESTMYSEDITIPLHFNNTYMHYNDLQKSIGMDLSQYCGKNCKAYHFEAMKSDKDDKEIMTLIVYENRLIGGDISQKDFDGYMKSLADNDEP